MFVLITTLLFSFSAWALELSPDTLILTHTSRYYHTNAETIYATENEIQKATTVIALAQFPIATDSDWYGFPLSKIQYEFYSHAGDHTLSFPKISKDGKFTVTVVGGYFSACLGRSLSTLIVNFLSDSGSILELIINLPMKAIFTGFIAKDGVLIPKTPYLESILDTSMDGLNLDEVLKLVAEKERSSFIKESIELAIFNRSNASFSLEAKINGRTLYQNASMGNRKKILLNLTSL